MQIGNLVHWRASEADPYRLWLIDKIDYDLNTVFLISEEHERQVVGLEDAGVLIVGNPVRDWHQITLPLKWGRIRALMIGPTRLLWLHEWVKIGEFQSGGILYIKPSVQLRYGQKITVIRERGGNTVLPVPRVLLSGKQKERLRKIYEKEKDELLRRPEGIYGLLQDDD